MTDEVAGVDREIGLSANADHQVAERPVVRELDPADRHRVGVALGGGRRDDADPDIAFDKPAYRIKAAQLNSQFEAAADPFGLVGKKTLQRARSVQPNKIEFEHVGKSDARFRRQRVPRRDNQHETVGAKRQGFKTGDLHCGGDDSDIRGAVGDGSDDLVTEPLLQIDVHLRVGGEEIAERLRQEFGQRVGVGQQANLSLDALGILRQLAVRALCLLQ